MKRYALLIHLIVVGIFVFFLSGCAGDPPITTVRVTDTSAYGKFNDYVNRDLAQSVSILPNEIPSNATVIEYNYNYCCAVLGDPNYSILLNLRFTDAESFTQERTRVLEMSGTDVQIIKSDSVERIYWGKTQEGLEKLTDSEVLDGLSVHIKYALLDNDNCQITYAMGLLWDGDEHDKKVIEVGLIP